MPEKWREKIGLEISGGEKTLHFLNVDALLDRRDWERPREGETERGDWSKFFGKSTGRREHCGNTPQPPLALPHKCDPDV
jgi:hypothetical protein